MREVAGIVSKYRGHLLNANLEQFRRRDWLVAGRVRRQPNVSVKSGIWPRGFASCSARSFGASLR